MNETETWKNNLAGGLLIGISLPGILTYVILWWILLIHKNDFSNIYYRYLFSMSLSNSLVLITHSAYFGICILTQSTVGGPRANTVIGAVIALGWFSGLPTLQTMVFSRYLEIRHVSTAIKFHTAKLANSIIAFSWIYGSVYGVIIAQDCCTLSFDFNQYLLNYDNWKNRGSQIMTYIDMANCAVTLLIIIVFNAATICHLRVSTKEMVNTLTTGTISNRTTAERRLFMITLTVSCCFALNLCFYFIVPYTTDSKWAFFTSILMTVIDRSVDGYINVFFNTIVWNHVLDVFKKKISTVDMEIPVILVTKDV